MEKIRKLHPEVVNSVRFVLAQKMMDEQFINWLYQSSTINLVEQLLKEIQKNKNIIEVNFSFHLYIYTYVHTYRTCLIHFS